MRACARPQSIWVCGCNKLPFQAEKVGVSICSAICRYKKCLLGPEKVGIKSGFFNGLLVGSVQFTFLGSYALALWYGGKRVRDGAYDGVLVPLP